MLKPDQFVPPAQPGSPLWLSQLDDRVSATAPQPDQEIQNETPRIGMLAGNAVAAAADATARDVEAAGEAMMNLATDLDVEAKKLADAIRACGERTRQAISGFTKVANDTAQRLRLERDKLAAFLDNTPGQA